jgi:hypothetical protein
VQALAMLDMALAGPSQDGEAGSQLNLIGFNEFATGFCP